MKKHYLLYSIGPVKSFINDSRKTQDLFAGSALLSKMTHKAIEKAKAVFVSNSFELITPIIQKKDDAIPNRFLAELSLGNGQINALNETMFEIEKTVQEFFIGKMLFKKIGLPEGALQQLESHLNIHWVIIEATSDYKTDFITINQQLASVKNLNAFDQEYEVGKKCHVDGRRNVKYYRKSEGKAPKLYQGSEDVKVVSNEETIKIWQLQEGEGISAVSMRKRLEQQKPHEFPSTVGVSLMDLFYKIENDNQYKNIRENFITYKTLVQGNEKGAKKFYNHSDDQLFYKENIKAIFKKNKQEEKAAKAHELHKIWSDKLDENSHFTKYYALVMFDGDTMGDWFTGVNFKPGTNLKEAQKLLSERLGIFATNIKESIKEPQGKVVFAGGEDFMAFVNIHHLETVINTIQSSFKKEVNDALSSIKQDGKELTISMGIAIAHYKQPLAMLIAKTYEMESFAKNNGRNRFAMAIMKHSGSTIQFSYHWNKSNVNNFSVVSAILELLNDKIFSPSFITNIYKSFENYGFEMEDFLVESKIALYVKQAYTGDKSNNKKVSIKDLVEHLKHLLFISVDNRNFGDTLLVLDFLYRKTY